MKEFFTEANMTHRVAVLSIGLVILNTPQLRAQAQPAAAMAFEVTSVKPNTSADPRRIGMEFLPGGRFVATNLPLLMIIATAYDVPFQSARLSGGPDWIRSERYDIEGKPEPGAIPPESTAKVRDEKVRLMLQTLLADRFKLTIRRDTKLKKAKTAQENCSDDPASESVCRKFSGGMGRGIHGLAVDMPGLALFVANWADRPVVDKSGLKGLFDIETVGWAPLRPRAPLAPGAEPSAEDLAMADPTRPTLFMIFDQLGLKLDSQRAPVESFVIEHVERPSGN